jgi:carboxyl-terminal processing protease
MRARRGTRQGWLFFHNRKPMITRAILTLSLLPVLAAADTAAPPDPEDAAYPAIERFIKAVEIVRKNYPDADKVTYDRLVNHALEGMMASLDPHSSFIHPEMAGLTGEGAPDTHIPSLGITLALRDDGPYLAGVDPQGPAARAGAMTGATLSAINGQAVEKADLRAILARLSGKPGETIHISLKSPASPHAIELSFAHRVVDTRAVSDAHKLPAPPDTGYVRLGEFTATSPRELEAALDELEDAGMKSLVLDLRGNRGGLLDSAVRILGLFLPPNTEVVTTRGRGAVITASLKTPERQRRKRDYPLTVLIDRSSASASELTAGALQDLKRARVVGEISYGKGSVQNIIPMGGNTALRVTIATYHTPSGRTPHHVGITPDVAVLLSDADRALLDLSRRKESLTPEEKSRVEAWKDPVLEAAVKN